MLRQFNEQRPYDLIILEYGLNVATERGRNYDNYQKGLLTAINHLKECFPQAGILLLSVGDRDYKTETGDLRTMPGVKNLIRYQQNIAAESGIAFWNMFEAMGGEGSMAKLVHAKPSMANYDYTHINFRGGKHLAGLLYETLIYGKEQYDRRRAYEKEETPARFHSHPYAYRNIGRPLLSFGVGGTRPDSRLPPSRKETENNQTLEGDELGE